MNSIMSRFPTVKNFTSWLGLSPPHPLDNPTFSAHQKLPAGADPQDPGGCATTPRRTHQAVRALEY
jgi:hypothetical protein